MPAKGTGGDRTRSGAKARRGGARELTVPLWLLLACLIALGLAIFIRCKVTPKGGEAPAGSVAKKEAPAPAPKPRIKKPRAPVPEPPVVPESPPQDKVPPPLAQTPPPGPRAPSVPGHR